MITTTLKSTTTPYSTFWSGGQKIARNKHGSMATFTVSQNAAYTAQAFEIRFWADGPATSMLVASGTHATNPPVIEAAESGEFYAIFTDWVTSNIYIYYWSDISQNTVPVLKVFSGTLGGKFSAVFDNYRRKLFVIGNHAGVLYTFDDEANLLTSLDMFNPGTFGQMEYPMLALGPEGRLHLFYTSYDLTSGADVNYRVVGYGWSPDGENWTHGGTPSPKWSGTPWVPLPSSGDEFSSFPVVRGEEYDMNTLLSFGFPDEDFTHIGYSVAPYKSQKFVLKSGDKTSMVYNRFNRKEGGIDHIRAPLNAGSYRPWFPGSFVTRRSDMLYHLAVDGTDMKVMTSVDDGRNWSLGATHPLPGTGFAHHLTCARGNTYDNDIQGLVTMVGASMDDWVNGIDPNGLASEVVHFRLDL